MIRRLMWRTVATLSVLLAALLIVVSQNFFRADVEGGWGQKWMLVVDVGSPGPTVYTVPDRALRKEDGREATVASSLGDVAVRLPDVVRVGDRAHIWFNGTDMARVRPLVPRNRVLDAAIVSALIVVSGMTLGLVWRKLRVRS